MNILKVLYVIDYNPIILMSRRNIGLDVPENVINWSWQLLEANGLSKYCDVFVVSNDRYIPSVKPDIVYSSCDSNSMLGYKLSKMYNVPFVCQVISKIPDYNDENWNIIKETLNKADVLIGVSPIVFKSLSENYPHIEIYMNYHGVNDELVDSLPSFLKRKGYITVCRLMKHKRVDMLLEAFCRLLKEEELIVIGDGPERTELEILNYILCNPAIFLGATDELTKFYYIKMSKAYISASKSEQFYIPLAESLYCKTPAIIYELDTIKDIYRNGNGSIFYFKNIDQLIKIIRRFDKMSSRKINKIGMKGRKYVIENDLTLTKRSKKLYNILSNVLERKR